MTETPVRSSAGPRRLDAAALSVWLCALAILSGLGLLVVTAWHGHGAEHQHGMPDEVPSHLHHVTMIAGMVLVMMSPFAVPLCSAVARAALWRRAVGAMFATWAAFMGLWVIAAGGMHVAGEFLAMVVTPSGAIAVLAILTAGAQLRWRRLTLLNACQRTRPIRAGHELRGGAAWGAVAAARCVRVCAAPMTLMAVEPTLLSFVAITALVWWERFSTRRLGLRAPLALGYLLIGAGMLIGVQS